MTGLTPPEGLSPKEQVLWAAEWDPSEHPRGPDGKFTEAPGLESAISAAEDFLDRETVHEPQNEMMAHGVKDAALKFAERWLQDNKEAFDMDRDDVLDAIEGKPDPSNGLGVKQVSEEWESNQYSSTAVKPLWGAASNIVERDDAEIPPDDWFDGDVDTTDKSPVPFSDGVNEAMKAVMAFSQAYAKRHLTDEDGKITVNRGLRGDLAEQAAEAKDGGESLEVDPRVVESWTVRDNAARYWADAGEDMGAILTRRISPEDVGVYGPTMLPGLFHQEEITTLGRGKYEIPPEDIQKFTGF